MYKDGGGFCILIRVFRSKWHLERANKLEKDVERKVVKKKIIMRGTIKCTKKLTQNMN